MMGWLSVHCTFRTPRVITRRSLDDLPLECVTCVRSYLSNREVSTNIARVSKTWFTASQTLVESRYQSSCFFDLEQTIVAYRNQCVLRMGIVSWINSQQDHQFIADMQQEFEARQRVSSDAVLIHQLCLRVAFSNAEACIMRGPDYRDVDDALLTRNMQWHEWFVYDCLMPIREIWGSPAPSWLRDVLGLAFKTSHNSGGRGGWSTSTLLHSDILDSIRAEWAADSDWRALLDFMIALPAEQNSANWCIVTALRNVHSELVNRETYLQCFMDFLGCCRQASWEDSEDGDVGTHTIETELTAMRGWRAFHDLLHAIRTAPELPVSVKIDLEAHLLQIAQRQLH